MNLREKITELEAREDELMGMMSRASASSIDVLAKEHKCVLKSLQYYSNIYYIQDEVESVDDIKFTIKENNNLCDEISRESKEALNQVSKDRAYYQEIIENLTNRIVRLEQIVSEGKDIKELI